MIDHLEGGGRFEQVLLQKGMDRDVAGQITSLAKDLGVPVQIVPVFRLNRVTRKNHQGVIAFTAWIEYSDMENVVQDCYERGEVHMLLVLDRITDVRNVGAIARSAEIFGATGIIVPTRETALINADAVKTSAGAIMNIPLCREKNLSQAVVKLQSMGLKVYAADQNGERLLYDTDLKEPCAFIMGAEGSGIHPGLVRKADATFSIPQSGKTDSLNVSVAAGVILYEAARQRKQSGQ